VTSQRLGGPASICISLREPNPNIFKTAQTELVARLDITNPSDLIPIFSSLMRSVAHCKLREYHGGRYAAHTIPHLPLNQTSNQILEVVCHAIMHHRRHSHHRAPSQKPPLSNYFSFFPTSSKRHEIISLLSGKLMMTISGATSDMSAPPVVHLSNCAVSVLNFSRLSQCATKRAQCYQKSVLFRWPCPLQPCAHLPQITIQRPNIWAFADMQFHPPSPDVYQ